MKAWCIIVAAGRSERFGGDCPKVLVPWRGRPLLAAAVDAARGCDAIAGIVLVASEVVETAWRALEGRGTGVHAIVRGGATRQESVARGLAAVPPEASIVLVHDGARPFATPALFAAVITAARDHGCALPLLAIHDTVKRVAADRVTGTVPRDDLRLAQTPQGFRMDVLAAAHAHAAERGVAATDDVALVEDALAAGRLAGVTIAAVPGEESNVKVTRPSDLPHRRTPRVGLGHDVHPLVPGRRFVLAGVDLQEGLGDAERFGPAGHSDGDALVHAICDALLGAAGLGDIGTWFPDTKAENAGRPSLEFLAAIRRQLEGDGYRIASVSAVIRLERPKLAPHVPALRAALAGALDLAPDAIGLSAKRGEGLDAVGEGRAVACDCVAVIERT